MSSPCTRCRRADATPRPTVATHCEVAPWSIVETSARHSALRVSHRALSAHFDTLSAQLGASPHAAEARLLEHGCCLQVKCGLERVPDPRASTAPHSDTRCTWHRMWICTAAQSAILRTSVHAPEACKLQHGGCLVVQLHQTGTQGVGVLSGSVRLMGDGWETILGVQQPSQLFQLLVLALVRSLPRLVWSSTAAV